MMTERDELEAKADAWMTERDGAPPTDAAVLERAAEILDSNGLDATAVRNGIKWLRAAAPASPAEGADTHDRRKLPSDAWTGREFCSRCGVRNTEPAWNRPCGAAAGGRGTP